MPLTSDLTLYLLNRARQVIDDVGIEPAGPLTSSVRFADVFDSMAMVEFLEDVAEDCRCEVGQLEDCVGQRFSTFEDLSRAMQAAAIAPAEFLRDASERSPAPDSDSGDSLGAELLSVPRIARQSSVSRRVWLAGSATRLARGVQSAAELDRAVGRPAGWLERRAGIVERRVWDGEEPVDAAAECVGQALDAASISRQDVAALLVVSETPPAAIGWGAAIHHRLDLPAATSCFELGGACTGFLLGLSLARQLVSSGPVVVAAVESHSRLLPLVPGAQGEAAALFGDGCSAVVLGGDQPGGREPLVELIDLVTYTDGSARDLIRVQPSSIGGYALEMDGVPLTEFALHALATATREIAAKHRISLAKLTALVAHGGNGRMPPMLARLLHLPVSKVWSDVKTTGNLGSASVPAAWSVRPLPPPGPVIWTAVGAGLHWGAALWQILPGPATSESAM